MIRMEREREESLAMIVMELVARVLSDNLELQEPMPKNN